MRLIPEVPAGFQLVAAYGVLLAVPQEWNPVMLRGHTFRGLARWLVNDPAPRGIIALADLRGTPLEVRWRAFSSPASAANALQKAVRRLKRSGVTLARQADAAIISNEASDNTTQVLFAGGHRLYELNLTNAGCIGRSVVDWFLRSNEQADRQEWLWSLYGCNGVVPRGAKVRKLVLQPGHVEIVLACRGLCITLGSFGLADRLIAPGSNLLAWAKSLQKEGRAAGQWELKGEVVSYTGTELRRFCRRVHHVMRFRHDPAQNRIAWEERQQWGTIATSGRAQQGIAEPG